MSLTCLLRPAPSVKKCAFSNHHGVSKMSKGPQIIEGDPIIDQMVKCTEGGMPTAEVKFNADGWMLNKNFMKYADRIKNFKVRPDDVWILSFPKCGTTWSQEMLWLLINNCNLEEANRIELYTRAPFLELKPICSEGFDMADSITAAEELPSPRLIKSHLPPDLLPSEIWTVKPKLLYVYRNPKDVAISYCHHYRLFNEYTGSQDLFIEAFLQDKVMFSPFWKHVLAYWNRRDLPQLKFITFDDMKKDLRSVLKSVAEHLNVTIPADREDEVLDHLSFARMSKNPMVNFEAERKEMGKLDQHFIRKGETGQWKKTLSEELVTRFDSWSNSFLAGSDFPYYS
ncbi:Sulfotransferase domain [Nesidiocoris tenuis]|uniref:Sulfotransferase domain n=1 Tax=Nesidiocoris tenuis TaxID=355587 RepID=A0ABN7BA71_9HEMI|nr:Sulfotransferase domain [Nesidiocoris tenuis]